MTTSKRKKPYLNLKTLFFGGVQVGHSSIDGVLCSNIRVAFVTILTIVEKKCQKLKNVLGNKDIRIFFTFQKLPKKCPFFTFLSLSM